MEHSNSGNEERRTGAPNPAAPELTALQDPEPLQAQLQRARSRDALTGLPNRDSFLEALARRMATGGANGCGAAVVVLDLDNFRRVNESLGHRRGDEMLLDVARRIADVLRPSDFFARLCADEFAVLLVDPPDAASAFGVAQRLDRALRTTVDFGEFCVFVTASVGVAFSLGGGDDPQALLRDAELAMHQVKEAGKSGSLLFHQEMGRLAEERLRLEAELRQALERQEFQVYYQPIVDLGTRQIGEFEALVRWQHPRRGFLTPDAFIPLAEECGFIDELGRWVLAEACRDRAVLARHASGSASLRVSVNLSPRQFQSPDLTRQILRTLTEEGLDPSCLTLEITETLMMTSGLASLDPMRELRAAGVRLAIDDFGTGYSSMRYLRDFPVDQLKIDRSFVASVGRGGVDLAIVAAVLDLARALGLSVTGEGVETAEQIDALRSLGCDRAQGYYFSPPVPLEAACSLLDATRHPASGLSSPGAATGYARGRMSDPLRLDPSPTRMAGS